MLSIYEKLMKIQAELKAPKNQYNSFGKYKYRSCEDILEGVKSLLEKNKAVLILTDQVKEINGRFYIEATAGLIDIDDGTTVSTTALAREDENKKGMDQAQVTGSASSYARKYALNGLFCIDDTEDSDSTNQGDKDEKPKQGTSNQGKSSQTGSSKGITDAQIKRLFAIANKHNVGEADIKKVIAKSYNKTSIKDLTKKEYDELIQRIESK